MEISRIGLGTVKFGRNRGVKYPQEFELPSDLAIETLLANAQSLGINLLDTAPAYGSSEERLGVLLKNKRHEWLICSKAGEEFIDGASHYDFSANAIIYSVERSLRRLKTDYLDFLLIHSDGQDLKIINEDNVFITLQNLKSAGKIRSFGMSTKTVEGGIETLKHADVAMVTHNLAYQDELPVIKYAHQNQKGIFIKKAIGSGHLSANESLRFIFQEPGVSSVIIGTLSSQHLRENVLVCHPAYLS